MFVFICWKYAHNFSLKHFYNGHFLTFASSYTAVIPGLHLLSLSHSLWSSYWIALKLNPCYEIWEPLVPWAFFDTLLLEVGSVSNSLLQREAWVFIWSSWTLKGQPPCYMEGVGGPVCTDVPLSGAVVHALLLFPFSPYLCTCLMDLVSWEVLEVSTLYPDLSLISVITLVEESRARSSGGGGACFTSVKVDGWPSPSFILYWWNNV